jgi:hypothetical protein
MPRLLPRFGSIGKSSTLPNDAAAHPDSESGSRLQSARLGHPPQHCYGGRVAAVAELGSLGTTRDRRVEAKTEITHYCHVHPLSVDSSG